mgnify:CR=1 FL=1|jgi:hypothetical protein
MNPTSITLRHLAAAAAIAAAVVLAFSAVVGHPHVKPLSAAELRSAVDTLVPSFAANPSDPATRRQ